MTPLGVRNGKIFVLPKLCRGSASTVATTREMIWLGTSNERRSPPLVSDDNASSTLASLSTSAGSAAVDAGAGPDDACAMGCWMTELALAGALDDVAAGGVVEGLVADVSGCMAMRTK